MTNFKIKDVNDMTIDELIGQVIMVGIPGYNLDSDYKKFIEDYKIGNYILFARNYKDTKQMQKFMKDLYEHAQNVTGSFPLVSIDQEGGMVVRLFKDVTFPASPLTTSATSVENAPYITGSIIAKDMLKFGINLNLAPCLEINDDLSNPLVNVRGYGATKEIVLKNATAFVKGVQDSGALSCIKHFPGAGSSTKDSHLELPIIDEAKENLINYNMYPFFHLKESSALMTSHCIYKSFDEIPSTLSKILLTDVLRNEVGYDGLIISDGMEMKAILDHYGLVDGTIMALNAGCDILLLCHEYEYQKLSLDTVKEAVKDGRISIDSLKEKVERINKAKYKVIDYLQKYFTEEEYIVNINEHMLMQDIVDNSFTLVKGNKPTLKDKTLILSSTTKVASIVEDEFDNYNLTRTLKNNFKDINIIEFRKEDSFKDEIMSIIDNYENIIIYSYDACNDKIQLDTINEILKRKEEVYVVSLKGPIDQKLFNNLLNYSCIYEYTPNGIKTIIKELNNEICLNGKLPK